MSGTTLLVHRKSLSSVLFTKVHCSHAALSWKPSILVIVVREVQHPSFVSTRPEWALVFLWSQFLPSPPYSASAWILVICVSFWEAPVPSGFRENVTSSKAPLTFHFTAAPWCSLAAPFIASFTSPSDSLPHIRMVEHLTFNLKSVFSIRWHVP